jgi:transposase
MSRKQRYIALIESEQITLRLGSNYHVKHEFRQRCQALLLSNKGWSIKQLAEHLEVGVHSISNWFNDWESSGLVGLMRQKGQGRKAILRLDNQEHTQALEKAVDAYYQDVGRIKAELETQLQLEMSNDRVKRFLKKIISPTTACARQPSLAKIPSSMVINTSGGNSY